MAVNLSPVGGVAAQFFTNTGAVLTGGKLFTYLAGTTTPAVAYTSSQGNTAWTNPIVLDAAGRVSGSGEIWITDGIIYKFVLKDSNDVLIATYDNITGINSNSVAYTNQQEIQTATANQTVFNLATMSYQPGTNSLSVFVDGVNQYGPGAQYAYTETDADTVTFVSGLHVGAQVKFTTTQQQGAGAVDASQVSYVPPFTGSVATNVEAKLAQTVSVMDFGAVGNGIANDTAAIQAAINSNAQNIYFPQGIYAISAPLLLAPYTQLFGVDGGNTSNASSSRIVALAGFSGNSMIESTAAVDPSSEKRYGLRDLFINGNNLVRNGVFWSGANSGQIFNVTVSNVREYGFKLVNNGAAFTANITMTNCYVRMPNDQYLINPVTYPIYAAYYIEGFFQVLTNCLSDGGVDGIRLAGGALGGYNVITNCHPEGWFQAGVVIDDDNGRNQIIGNQIIGSYNDATTPLGIQIGVYVTGDGDNNIISNNVINGLAALPYSVNSFGVYVLSNALDPSAGNVITSNFIGGFNYGVKIELSPLNVMSSNTIGSAITGYVINGASNAINGGYVGYGGAGFMVQSLVTTTTVSQLQGVESFSGCYMQEKPPAFSAYQSTPQALPNVTPTKVLFQTEEFDTAGNFASSIFTAPVSGYYQINSCVTLDSAPTAFVITIRVQGNPYKQNAYEAGDRAASASSLVYMLAGNSLEIYVTVAGTPNTVATSTDTWVNGYLVRQV